MKRILILFLIFFITIPGKFAYCKNTNNKLNNLNSRYAIVMDSKSGRVLFEKNSKKVVPMASTTKIMTAIIALENSNLNDIVTISKRASSIHGSSIGLKFGQKLTMEELLYGLMLRSGNDCAIAIAEFIGGSVERFAEIMNSKAFDIGAFDTHFSTPHGLDGDGHFTTAYDLALITKYAMGNEMFQKIVSTKDVVLNGVKEQRNFHNINKILWQVDGANGVKTGFTGKAGKCLVSSAFRDNKKIICVVLDSNNRWDDSKVLLEYGLKNFNNELSINALEYNFTIPVENGVRSGINIGLDEGVTIPLSEEEKNGISVQKILPDNLTAPLYKGQQIGRLTLNFNGKELFAVPFILKESVNKSSTKNFFDIFK